VAREVAAVQQDCYMKGNDSCERGSEHAGFMVLRSTRDLLKGSTGCHLWPASLWLSQYILRNPHLVRGKHCAELGCGVGLLGLCLTRCGADKVASSADLLEL
jgi:hypothetical protein